MDAATSNTEIPPTADISSDEEDGEEYDDDPDTTLDSIVKSKTINFSICANYTNWKPREAFHELIQNWRDAIIESFDLAEQDFCVIRGEKTSGLSTEIVYQVARFGADDSKECLGYIRYKGHNGEGTVEITNRSATLQPWHLDIGGTSKAGVVSQAGAHGEGLKLALLVLMRGPQDHAIKCRSGGFNWTFNFTTRGRLMARLDRMSPQSIHKAQDLAERMSKRTGTLIPFGAKPHGDVQFIIGDGGREARKGRNQSGKAVTRVTVKREDFDAWTKAALFLHEAQNGAIISTKEGDLLTDPRLHGNLYLKGLLLCESTPKLSASITNRPLKFGYNFASGTTNRERQSMASAREESKHILAIWSQVLAANPEMVSELSGMLNTANNGAGQLYADVFGAKAYINLETACRLKEYLFGEQFAGKWYYCGEDKKKNPRLDHIIQGLGYESVELTDTYWIILRGHSLVRTAEEEECWRFTTASPVTRNRGAESSFATSVYRLLRACLRACPQTNDMSIDFVQAGQLHLPLFYLKHGRMLLVHERWLSIGRAINELGLPKDWVEDNIIFHTVKRLFADALKQLPLGLFYDKSRTAEEQRDLEISLAEQRLLNYLRMRSLSVAAVSGCADLRVDWAVAPDFPKDLVVEIQCHKESWCPHLRESLLIAEDARRDKMAYSEPQDEGELSTCRTSLTEYSVGAHHERYLEEDEEYFFVLVAPADPASFAVVSGVTRTARRQSSPARAGYLTGNPTSSAPAGATASEGLFALGLRLQSLDIFEVDTDRWYEAESSENVRAVIGIIKGEKCLPQETRKRRRLDGE